MFSLIHIYVDKLLICIKLIHIYTYICISFLTWEMGINLLLELLGGSSRKAPNTVAAVINSSNNILIFLSMHRSTQEKSGDEGSGSSSAMISL